MKVLVIGGAGYLGSVLCKKLMEEKYSVRVLDSLIHENKPIFYDEFVKGDMRDLQTVANAFKDIDAVIHLAAIVGDPACKLNPESTIEINYLGTRLIAELCRHRKIKKFIYASSCSVYGERNNVLTEESKVNPVSLYAEMKYKSEQGIMEYDPVILRMGTLYGRSPRMRFDLVVNLLIAKATIDKKFSVFGGDQWRPFLHVDDAASAYILCLQKECKGIYNVCSENHKIEDIGRLIKENVGGTLTIDTKKEDNRNYIVSSDKIKTLGFKPRHTVKEWVKELNELITNPSMQGIYNNYQDKKYRNS